MGTHLVRMAGEQSCPVTHVGKDTAKRVEEAQWEDHGKATLEPKNSGRKTEPFLSVA